MADAMEMMILSILAPQLHCEWKLPSLEVALLTSVKAVLMSRKCFCLHLHKTSQMAIDYVSEDYLETSPWMTKYSQLQREQ